ncbi:MAG TPA: hypothetical protein DCE56_29515 [Cyanobacteria bacterium UBA8553]|nr:hypothetical protein [Cyanobacteria bacterium UBA8553]
MSRNYYYQLTASEQITLFFAIALTAILWVFLWGHIIYKLGYRGIIRKLLLVGMCIPPVNWFVFLGMMLLPWPVHIQLRQVQKQLDAQSSVKPVKPSVPIDPVEAELKRMKDNL